MIGKFIYHALDRVLSGIVATGFVIVCGRFRDSEGNFIDPKHNPNDQTALASPGLRFVIYIFHS